MSTSYRAISAASNPRSKTGVIKSSVGRSLPGAWTSARIRTGKPLRPSRHGHGAACLWSALREFEIPNPKQIQKLNIRNNGSLAPPRWEGRNADAPHAQSWERFRANPGCFFLTALAAPRPNGLKVLNFEFVWDLGFRIFGPHGDELTISGQTPARHLELFNAEAVAPVAGPRCCPTFSSTPLQNGPGCCLLLVL
jgi:hypothetical protein